MKNLFNKIQFFLIPLLILVLFFNIGCASLAHTASAADMGNHMPSGVSIDVYDMAQVNQNCCLLAHHENAHRLVGFSQRSPDYSNVFVSALPVKQVFSLEITPQTASPPYSSVAVLRNFGQIKAILRC